MSSIAVPAVINGFTKHFWASAGDTSQAEREPQSYEGAFYIHGGGAKEQNDHESNLKPYYYLVPKVAVNFHMLQQHNIDFVNFIATDQLLEMSPHAFIRIVSRA